MILTLEEKKSIIRMVLKEYQNITISEIKSNSNIKKEIKLNLKFYSGLKEAIGLDWVSSIINFIGGIKDFLTATDIGKWIVKTVQKIANKLSPTYSKDPNDWTDKLVNFFKKVKEWIGPKFIAYLIAAWKKKSFKPSDEEIKAQMKPAEVIYKIILGILICLAIYKLWAFIGPFYTAAIGASAGSALLGAAKAAGIKGILGGTFNIMGLVSKISHLGHAEGKKEIEKEYQKAISNLNNTADDIFKNSSTNSPTGDYYNAESLRINKYLI
jgi:hypothetical protein